MFRTADPGAFGLKSCLKANDKCSGHTWSQAGGPPGYNIYLVCYVRDAGEEGYVFIHDVICASINDKISIGFFIGLNFSLSWGCAHFVHVSSANIDVEILVL